MESIAFWIIGSVVLLSAALMVASRNLVHAIVYMVISVIGVGGLFILLPLADEDGEVAMILGAADAVRSPERVPERVRWPATPPAGVGYARG
mgnify:CR=1 FL=1